MATTSKATKPGTPEKPDPTKGYKTSEFWVTAITGLFVTLNQSGILGFTIPVDTLTPIIALTATYVVGRSAVKGLNK